MRQEGGPRSFVTALSSRRGDVTCPIVLPSQATPSAVHPPDCRDIVPHYSSKSTSKRASQPWAPSPLEIETSFRRVQSPSRCAWYSPTDSSAGIAREASKYVRHALTRPGRGQSTTTGAGRARHLPSTFVFSARVGRKPDEPRRSPPPAKFRSMIQQSKSEVLNGRRGGRKRSLCHPLSTWRLTSHISQKKMGFDVCLESPL